MKRNIIAGLITLALCAFIWWSAFNMEIARSIIIGIAISFSVVFVFIGIRDLLENGL